MTDNDADMISRDIDSGEFPFPLVDGPVESRYLTWLRNHSNYLAARGFLDYVRSIGVLVRGIVINFLIFLPHLLLIAIVLSLLHHTMLGAPYWLTTRILALSIVLIVLYPAGAQIFKIVRYRNSLVGRESNVKLRDRVERLFGLLLILIVASAALESMPWILEFLRERLQDAKFGWPEGAAAVAAATAFLGGSDKILSMFSGLKKKVAMLVIGLIGLLVPMSVVLFATDFLVFGIPPSPMWMYSPLIVPFLCVICLFLALFFGSWRRAFSKREYVGVACLLTAGCGLAGIVIACSAYASFETFESREETITKIIDPLSKMASEFHKISDPDALAPEVVELVEQVVVVEGRYTRTKQDASKSLVGTGRHAALERRIADLTSARAPGPLAQDEVEGNEGPEQAPRQTWRELIAEWLDIEKRANSEGTQFEAGQNFISLVNELSILPKGRLEPLQQRIAQLAVHKMVEFRPGITPSEVANILRRELLETGVQFAAKEAFYNGSLLNTADDLHTSNNVFRQSTNKLVAQSPDKSEGTFAAIVKDVRDTLGQLRGAVKIGSNDASNAPSNLEAKLVEDSPTIMKLNLMEWSNQELARLTDVDRLLDYLGEAVEERESKMELSKMTGREELARLLSKKEIVDLIIDKPTSANAVQSEVSSVETNREGNSLTEWSLLTNPMLDLFIAEATADQAELAAKTLEENLKTRARRELIRLALPGSNRTLYDWGEGKKVSAAEKCDVAVKLAELTVGWRRNMSEPSEETYSDKEIATVAAKEIARLALEDFDLRSLTMVSLEPDLFVGTFSETYRNLNVFDKQFESLDHNEYDDKFRINTLTLDPDSQAHLLTADFDFHKLVSLAKAAFEECDDANIAANALTEDAPQQAGDLTFPNVYKVLLAQRALCESSRLLSDHNLPKNTGQEKTTDAQSKHVDLINARGYAALARLAREIIVERALKYNINPASGANPSAEARELLHKLYHHPSQGSYGDSFTPGELGQIAIAKVYPFIPTDAADRLVSTMIFGKYGALDQGVLRSAKAELSYAVMVPKLIFLILIAAVIWLGCWLTVDVNLTSIHGFNRDRLAAAFLIGKNSDGAIDIETDLDLEDICRHEARSKAPYHLINVAINLQGSQDIGIRDRNSDFFIFSKRFVGGHRTGYCRSQTLENAFPQISLATAMAISAAAASPNMGRGTSRLLVGFMTMLNIRMGFWIPNPGLLEQNDHGRWWWGRPRDSREKYTPTSMCESPQPPGFAFSEVFVQELSDIQSRWQQAYPDAVHNRVCAGTNQPTVDHALLGIGFSGGGIRSAAINLGITQALQANGVFDHADYLSTVSGGGYLGTSLSTLMRSRTGLVAEIAGTVDISLEKIRSEFAGQASVTRLESSGEHQIVVTTANRSETYLFPADDRILIKDGDKVDKEQLLVGRRIVGERSEFAGKVTITQLADSTGYDVLVTGPEVSKNYRFPSDAELLIKDGQRIEKDQLLATNHSTITKNITNHGQSEDHAYGLMRYKIVTVTSPENGDQKTYRFSENAELNVKQNVNVAAGKLLLKRDRTDGNSEINGTVSVATDKQTREHIVIVQGFHSDERREHRFSKFEQLVVETGQTVEKGQSLIRRRNTLGERFRWRVRPMAFLREMVSKLDEKHAWVNLSDGGHLENLATIELLRRRCKYIIIGDGEADPKLHFNGLATLIRTARIDLGVEIEINVDAIRLKEKADQHVSREHFAFGRILYPQDEHVGKEVGYLLYLKSSYTDDEGEVIKEYRQRHPSFPHQTTADQFFDEGQFEAYRALGQHIAEESLKGPGGELPKTRMNFSDVESWFKDRFGSSHPEEPNDKDVGTKRTGTKKKGRGRS